MTSRAVELRSDTFTRPTSSMRAAMASAEVGDDVWNEDPTVRELERRAARLTGKEAALFVSSGTQGNLIGVLSHTSPGDELIVGDQAHIVWNEVGGLSVIGGVQLRPIPNRRGHIDPADVAAAIRVPDILPMRTGCLAIENTHNRCGGAVSTPSQLDELTDVAHAAGVRVHLDGARIFNAAVALGCPASDLTRSVDSVTFCLSKGLGAPVGSLLCGDEAYIARARRWRTMLGGGMRQVGILAAAGLVALDENIDRLADDHQNARRLARGLARRPDVSIDVEAVQTNIVNIDVARFPVGPAELCRRLLRLNVRMAPSGPTVIRAVTSYEVDADDIDAALAAFEEVSAEMVAAPV